MGEHLLAHLTRVCAIECRIFLDSPIDMWEKVAIASRFKILSSSLFNVLYHAVPFFIILVGQPIDDKTQLYDRMF